MPTPPARIAALTVVALLALFYAACSMTMVLLLLLRWSEGRPAVSVLEAFAPGLTVFAPGDEIESPFGGQPIVVTETMRRAVASANVGLFTASAVAWAVAARGLARVRTWGRALGLFLFGGTAVLGLLNLAVLVLAIGTVGAAAAIDLAAPLLVVACGLVLLPGGACVALVAPACRLAFRQAAAMPRDDRRLPGLASPLIAALTVHFLLVGGALLAGAFLPASVLPPSFLLGVRVLEGPPARVATLGLALAHLTCAVGFARLRRRAWWLAMGLNGALTVLLILGAVGAPAADLAVLGSGLVAERSVRALLWVLALSAAGLVLTVAAARSRFPRSGGSV